MERDKEREKRAAVHVAETLKGVLMINPKIAKEVAEETVERAVTYGQSRSEKILKNLGSILGNLAFAALLCGLLGLLGFAIFKLITSSDYPKQYTAVPESHRFSNETYSFHNGRYTDVRNRLCINEGYSDSKGDSVQCIHPNRLEKLNQALEQAVANDVNGEFWNEPNGRGEIWKIERNYYRFIITAEKDENYK